MKKLLIGLTLLSAISSFANEGVISRVSTSDVEGTDGHGAVAEKCIYQASIDTYHSGKKELKIKLGSDDAAFIFFGFELPAKTKLPLKDGFSYSKNNYELVTYKKGILKYTSKERDDAFTTHYEEIELEVTSDLKVITKADAVDYTKRAFFKKVAKSMNCNF